jgi:hypothetical protein
MLKKYLLIHEDNIFRNADLGLRISLRKIQSLKSQAEFYFKINMS